MLILLLNNPFPDLGSCLNATSWEILVHGDLSSFGTQNEQTRDYITQLSLPVPVYMKLKKVSMHKSWNEFVSFMRMIINLRKQVRVT